jgi:16S rRNA (cytosine967-C5)-methyltransferase
VTRVSRRPPRLKLLLNLHRKLLDVATEALGLVLRFEQPADAVLNQYFRQHHALGHNDRAFVADTVYGVLRHKRVLDHMTDDGNARQLLLGWVARFSGLNVSDISSALKSSEVDAMGELKAMPLEPASIAVRTEFPDWVYERLAARLSEAEVIALGHTLQEPAPLDLRVNTFRTDRESVLRTLGKGGVQASATPYSPVGIRVTGKPSINREQLFLEGAIEVQDEGSQLVSYLLAPTRHDLVVDFCAGAGGKSLMLGAMMHSQGRLYAFDVSAARLARLKPRLKRSGLSNLHPHLLRTEHDPKVKRLAGKIDRVLVDAPCSGLGTLRRNPDLKWRQSPEGVLEMCAKQASILASASTLVKPGGRLVYATCSLLAEENEDVVDTFLKEHPEFTPVHCGKILRQQGVEIDAGERMRLWPHVHGTDGFFAAGFERARQTFP